MTICSLRDLQKGQKQRRLAAEEKLVTESDTISKMQNHNLECANESILQKVPVRSQIIS